MLDMGFEEPIREITAKTPKDRQSLLFSATFTDAIREIARNTLRDPLEVTVDAAQEQAVIEQRFLQVDPARKQTALAGLLAQHRVESGVVFCNMRKDVDEVAGSLQHFGFSALALHGDMEQRDRDEVLVRFANRSCNVLVASDVAARGLDIEDLALVVNYDMPSDADTYVHRIGRTGRAGRDGLAISLCTPRELPRADVIQERLGAPLLWDRHVPTAPKAHAAPAAAMTTLRIDAGKTDKLRPGDVLGALTGDAGLSASAIGKINVFATRTYVAVARDKAGAALARLNAGKIKGRSFRVRKL
jgi:ATP-independent RNA helicase DbpA